MKRVFILIVAILFSIQYIAGGVPILTESAPSTPSINKDIFIPESYGFVEKTSFDKYASSRFVVLLKDAHCNYDAQHNIAKILEVLIKDYKIDLVAIEGAIGNLDYSRFWKMENEDAREKMADSFVKNGILSGPEYLTITKDGKLSFNIYGIEDEKFYIENFVAFRETISHQEEALLFINELTRIVKGLKAKIYQKELLEFDNKSMQYYENALSLTDWVKELKVESVRLIMSLKEYPNIMLTLDSIGLEEKIDFKMVETERAGAIGDLEEVLSGESLKVMIEKSLQFRLGRISSSDYYGYLEKLLKLTGGGDPAAKFPNLIKYIQLVKLQTWINNNALFSEMAELEDIIKDTMFQNEIQRQLDSISKKARILNGLFNLTLNRDDLLYYRENRALFAPDSMVDFINIQAPLNNVPTSMLLGDRGFLDKVEDVIVNGEKFYDVAVQRDVSLVENTLRVMDEKKKINAVMVIGGFHTGGVLHLFETKGVGYVVVTPKIVKAEKEGLYLSLMMDKRIKPIGETSSLSYIHTTPDGAENERLLVKLGAGGLRMNRLGLAERLYNKYLGKVLKVTEGAMRPFDIVFGEDKKVHISRNPEFRGEIPDSVLKCFEMGLEEVLQKNPELTEFISDRENAIKYLNKTALLEYEHDVSHTRQEGILRKATLGFITFYLGVCKAYQDGGLENLPQEIREEFLPEVIRELEAGKGYKWPEIRGKLVPEMQKRLGEDTAGTAETVVNYLLTMPAYGIDGEGQFYQTLFFKSYLGLLKDMLKVEEGDELDKLLNSLRVYRYMQTYVAKIFDAKPELILETDDIRTILRVESGKRVEIIVRFMASDREEFKDHSESIKKLIGGKMGSGWRSVGWLAEANNINVRNESTVLDPIKRNVYTTTLLRAGKISDLDVPKRYREEIDRLLPRPAGEVRKLEGRTMIRGCSLYVSNIEDKGDDFYEYSDLSRLGLDTIKEMNEVGVKQYYLYETEIQKELMKKKLRDNEIQFAEEDFVSVSEYENIPRDRVTVALLGNKFKETIKGRAGDRLLIGNEEGSDLMLMDRAAFNMLGEDVLDETKLRDIFRQILTNYYGGAYSEGDIEKFLENITMVDSVIKIILPPITPFVREYYDTLIRSREVISKAA